MKLNNPIQVKTDLNEQKRLDIDLGVKLANRVDNLRQTLSLEEQKMEKFKTENISIIQKEIDDKIREKEILDKEINNLKEEKKILLIPLDNEWNDIKKEKEKLKTQREEQGKVSINLVNSIKNVESREEWNKFETNRIKKLEATIKIQKESSEKQLAKSTSILEEAELKAKEIINPLLEREKQVEEKLEQINIFKETLEQEKENIANEYKYIEEEKRRLSDQRGIIERQLKRL